MLFDKPRILDINRINEYRIRGGVISGNCDIFLPNNITGSNNSFILNTTLIPITSGIDSRLNVVELTNADQQTTLSILTSVSGSSGISSASLSAYALNSNVQAMSAGLNSRLNVVELTNVDQQNTLSQLTALSGSYASKIYVDSISGWLHQDIENLDLDLQSQITELKTTTIALSGYISSISGSSVNVDSNSLSAYALNSNVQAMSAGLNSRISIVELSNNDQQSTLSQLTSLSGSYASLPYVNDASASLLQDVDNLDLDLQKQIYIIKMKTDDISGVVNTLITTVNSLSITGSGYSGTQNLSAYALNSNVQAMSAGLNSRLNVVELTNVDQQTTLSILSSVSGSSSIVSASLSAYALNSNVQAMSAGLNTRLVNVETVNSDQQTTLSILSSVSGSSSIVSASLSAYALNSNVQAMSAGLNTRLNVVELTNVDQQNTLSQLTSLSGSSSPSTYSLGLSGASVLVNNISFIEFTGTGISSITSPTSGKAVVQVTAGAGGSPVVTSVSGNTFSPDGTSDVYDYMITASSSVTLNAPSSFTNGKTIVFRFRQPSGANAPISFANGSGFTWKLPNGTITLTTDTGYAEDIISVIRIGSMLYASIVKNFS